MDYNSRRHVGYYVGLLIVFGAGLVLISQAFHSLNLVMAVTIFMAVFYVGWALLHHYIHHDIHAKIVVEYTLLGALGISVVYFTLFLLK